MAGEKTRSRPYRKAKYASQFIKTAKNKKKARALHLKNNPNDNQAKKKYEENI